MSSERLRSLAGSSRVQPSRLSMKKKNTHANTSLFLFFCPSASSSSHCVSSGLSGRDKRGQNCHASCDASHAFDASKWPAPIWQSSDSTFTTAASLTAIWFLCFFQTRWQVLLRTLAWRNLIYFAYFSQVKSRQHLPPCTREAAIKGGRALGSQLAINHSYWHLL